MLQLHTWSFRDGNGVEKWKLPIRLFRLGGGSGADSPFGGSGGLIVFIISIFYKY